ncbi:MAG: VWA domain-containing protein, partial [Proteobacteria bacterium]|nr:VWA domain-containing protein [Pseudomonadota bacterium]
MRKLISIIILVLVLCQAGALGVLADDTDIYGTTSISVQPNVLIIFDTSGSMSQKIPGEEYNPANNYNVVSWATNKVYREQDNGVIVEFASSINNILCPSINNALLTKGYATTGSGGIDKIDNGNAGNYNCGNKKIKLRMGNWLNYDAAGYGDPVEKIVVAKNAIKKLIDDTDNVRFGLMRFNNSEGGRIAKEIGASKVDLKATIDSFAASGWTPLAETLAEAGLYFAGKSSWFNNNVTYTSPIEKRCQKNYVILMTDGESTYDNNIKLTTGIYINGNLIGDYDHDGKDPGTYDDYGTDYLDDVAKYLYDNDMRLDLGESGESFERQNIITFTIGFATAQQLLQDTAANGGGRYYTTSSASGLSAAFEDIMAAIVDVNAVFVSPVVPVSRMNRTYAGDSIYVGFFKPDTSGNWSGNIK